MEHVQGSSPKINGPRTMNWPLVNTYHGTKGEQKMKETLHPNEVILTPEVVAQLLLDGSTPSKERALKEQQERQERIRNATSG